MSKRVDRGTRVILAPARTLYRAFLNPEAVACWRAPKGMHGAVELFEPRVGGRYSMAFHYDDKLAHAGKSGDGVDRFEGEFVELVPDEKIVEAVRFASDDPDYGGVMTIVTTFLPDRDGTRVVVECHDVPPGISFKDHREGIDSSLRNLALFAE